MTFFTAMTVGEHRSCAAVAACHDGGSHDPPRGSPMFKTRRSMAIVAGLGVLALAVAAAFWVSRSGTVTGEICDTAIVLSPDHAGAVVNVELRNVGSEQCDLIVVLTSLPVDALPVESGRVVVYDGLSVAMGPDGSPPPGLPMVGRPTQINGPAAPPGRVCGGSV